MPESFISIDVTKLVPPAVMAQPQLMLMALADIAEATRAEIIRLAGLRLRSAEQDYVQGLQPVEYHARPEELPHRGTTVFATIALVGWLPNAVEHGWEGGDMKQWVARWRTAKYSVRRGAWYAHVPFRHMGPDATGRNAPPMGSAYVEMLGAERARKLGQKVYAAARQLRPTTGHPRTGTQWGGRLPAGLAPKLRDWHTTDIYAGMVREVKAYSQRPGEPAVQQAQYKTWRTISERSAPDKWLHPGIEARELFREAAPYAATWARMAMEKAAAQAGGGGGNG